MSSDPQTVHHTSGEAFAAPDIPEITIEATSDWRFIDWQELWRYRDMIGFMVLREIKGQYAQSVLGYGWAFVRPVVSMVIFTLIFGLLVSVDSDGAPYPVFSYVALVPWGYFSAALSSVSGSLVSGMAIINKVYFPRMILPLVTVFTKLIDFGIAALMIFVLMLWFGITPTIWVIFLPFLVLQMMVSALGVGLWAAATAVQFRDVQRLIGFAVTILMYLSPVIYPVSMIPEQYRLLYGLNPMAGVIEGFRSALLGTNPMPWDLIGMGMIPTVMLFISGAFIFHRLERTMVDVA